MSSVTNEDIEELLVLFSRKGQYDARTGEQNNEIHKRCEELFEKDYICSKIENDKGSLSTNYPSRIIVPAQEKGAKEAEFQKGPLEGVDRFDGHKFKEIANKSNLARCRTRFPVPVILCDGKFVCRSATLACGGEMLLRDMSGCIFNTAMPTETEEKNSASYTRNGALFTELRSQDIKLLKGLSVNYICDLMVENKKVKYGLKVSSSEKIDKENRYSDFNIVQLPYPGCEFFKKFKDSNYVAEGLMFDWEQNYVDSSLTLPSDCIASSLGIHWGNYKLWDIVKLTQNYLKLLTTYAIDGTTGILIHCISGWDRTPLFVSLLRMSLWADGRVHTSLCPTEIAYLTLAYDWYLFGHDLPSRLRVGEEILFFCFEFLKFITSEDFSSKRRSRKVSSNGADTSLDILIEEEARDTFVGKKCLSTFYAPLEDGMPTATFYAGADSGDDSDSIKSAKSSSIPETGSSDGDNPPTLVNSTVSNNNGPSSSPVPVPHARTRIDSMSSLGSWQYVSGCGSLLGSVTSKSSSELNRSNSNSSLHMENGNQNPSSGSQERLEKLSAVRTIVQRAYRQAVESRDGTGYGYFPWRR